MCGPYDSVIGQEKSRIIERFLTGMPVRFEVATGDAQVHGVIVILTRKPERLEALSEFRKSYYRK